MNRIIFLVRFIFGLILILLLSACGRNSAASPPAAANATEVPTEGILAPTFPVATPTPETLSTPEPAIPETRRLTLEFPPRIRAGDSDIARLTLEVDELGNITPTAVINGNVVTGKVIKIPNLYETHHVIAEARFDIAGMQVAPPDLVSQTLERGQSVIFKWSLRPPQAGVYRGTVWLYLRFVDKSNGEESQIAISAQDVEIEAVNLLGFSGSLARAVGGFGSAVGAIISFPFFEDIVKYIFTKGRKQAK